MAIWLIDLFALSALAMPNVHAQPAREDLKSLVRPLTDCERQLSAKTVDWCIEEWTTFEEVEGLIIYWYQSEKFDVLERALKEFAQSTKRFASGKSPASAAYWAFRRSIPAPGVSPFEKDRIARWRRVVPESYFATFAEARFAYANAWNVRGSGYGNSVSRESWELYAARLAESERILLDAPNELKGTPLWHNLLLAISLETDQVQSTPKSTFTNALQTWPDYYDFYEVMLTRLVPKWGGSWEEVDTFINYWSAKRAGSEGTSLYARLYAGLRTQGVTPDQTKMKWGKMKASFVDLIKRYPDPAFKNLYASYACFYKDRAAFADATSGLTGRLLMAQYWLSGHSHEACLRWAVV